MDRFMITHSLLSSWDWCLSENPYEDITNQKDSLGEFLTTLQRIETPTTPAMQDGIDFEDMVTDIIYGRPPRDNPQWFDAANEVAAMLRGAQLQVKSKKIVRLSSPWEWLVYGRPDAVKAGTVYDIKFSKKYERGKYYDSTQHPMYFEIVPGASDFVYIISNGTNVWTEAYRKEETRSIYPQIESFAEWLSITGYLPMYKEHWKAL